MTLAKIDPAATDVWLYNLPGITAVPDMPAATDVWLYNLPGITAEMVFAAAPNATVWINWQKMRR